MTPANRISALLSYSISLDSQATLCWLPVLLGVPYRCEFEVVRRNLAQEATRIERGN